MNHRCPTRVITLINKIRRDEDDEEQQPRSDAKQGVVRLFVVSQSIADKSAAEATVAARMAELTGDPSWAAGAEAIKTLALEHLMSARRFGFEQFFEPLYAVERIRTSFLQGTGRASDFSRARYCRWSRPCAREIGLLSLRSFGAHLHSSSARRLKLQARSRLAFSARSRLLAMACWPW